MVVDIEQLWADRDALKDEQSLLDLQIKRLNARIMQELEAQGGSHDLPDGRTIKVVKGVSRSYDWNSLKVQLDPETWNSLLEPSKSKLDSLIEEVRIPVSKVARFSVQKNREPFVRDFTSKTP